MQVRPLTCQIHDSEPLISLCLSQDCPNPGLICYLCTLYQHKDHEDYIPFKVLINELLKKPQNLVENISKIDFVLEKIKARVEQLLKKSKTSQETLILQTYQNYQSQIRREINASISSIDELQDYFQIINPVEQVNSINSWFKRNRKLTVYEEKNEKQEIVRKSPLVIYLADYLVELEGVEESINKIIKQGKFEESQLLELLTKDQTTNFTSGKKLHFSQSLMGPCMKLDGPYKASVTVSSSKRMMLLEPALSNRKVKKWRMKIIKQASWIGVGVSHLDSVTGVNFDFVYTQKGHGNYIIAHHGYSWNGYDMTANGTAKSFSFKSDDVIEMEYDPKSSQLRFKKEGTGETYKLDLDPDQKPMHACVNLGGVGDCVQVL